MSGPRLDVDVYFDLVCPWCLIGKQHLRRALAQLDDSHPDVRVQVLWHSVQLVPDVPDHGWPFIEFYERRLGGRHQTQARQSQVVAAAAHAGAAIDFSRIVTFPNTAKAHRLVALGQRKLDSASQDRLLDRLFAAYFQRGEDLGDTRTLAAIAAELGLEPAATADALADSTAVCEPIAAPGVPYFVFNRRFALSGAQAPDVLHACMREAIGH